MSLTSRLKALGGLRFRSSISTGSLARVEQVIGQAQDRGVTVILDLHHFNELMDDPDTYTPLFIVIWTEVAQHSADYDGRLIFELLNEPRDQMTTQRTVALYEKVLPRN